MRRLGVLLSACVCAWICGFVYVRASCVRVFVSVFFVCVPVCLMSPRSVTYATFASSSCVRMDTCVHPGVSSPISCMIEFTHKVIYEIFFIFFLSCTSLMLLILKCQRARHHIEHFGDFQAGNARLGMCCSVCHDRWNASVNVYECG
jgi:hypothetical protein